MQQIIDTMSELERLRARVAEAEARAEEAEEERRRLQQVNARLEQENQLQHKTTLSRYLEYCHRFLFLSLAVRSGASKTSTTKVDGKFYPSILRPWDGFVETQQRHFNIIKTY
ncbi:hypothetical protein MFIFM68171_10132 [Madurella fahalii]|uniref:Uncharacterized protein n=1 Tax=Madurella fahalii TaxID=1157608 RepID=A0ABQ0GQB9_9PEZI